MKLSAIKSGTAIFLALSLALPAYLMAADQEIEALYKRQCAACHAADGSGNTAAGKKTGARDFAAPEVQKQSDAELLKIIAEGKNKMPGYEKKLNADQMKRLVSNIRALSSTK